MIEEYKQKTNKCEIINDVQFEADKKYLYNPSDSEESSESEE